MAEDPEKALLHHANQQFFAAIELASQKETHKAIQEFEKAITLFNLLSASTFPRFYLLFMYKTLFGTVFYHHQLD